MNPPETAIRQMGPREWGLLGCLSLLWGGSFFFVEIALRELPPFTVVFGRVALAAVALGLLVRVLGHRVPREPRLWAGFLLLGAIGNMVPFSLIVWGQTQITGGLASILNATTPLFTVVLAHFLTTDEKLTAHKAVGVAIGLVGVVVMIGTDALAGLGRDVLAQLAVVGAGACYGFAIIYARRFRGTPSLVMAAGQVGAAAVLLLPVALIVDEPWTLFPVGAVTWGAVLAMALLSTALAYLIFFRILRTAGATNVALVTFLIPISAILLGVTLLGERLEPRQVAGMALIGLGLAAIDGRLLRRLRRAGRRNG